LVFFEQPQRGKGAKGQRLQWLSRKVKRSFHMSTTPETKSEPVPRSTFQSLNDRIVNNLIWFALAMIVLGAMGAMGVWSGVTQWASDAALATLRDNDAVKTQIEHEVSEAVTIAVNNAMSQDSVPTLVAEHIRKDDVFTKDIIVKIRTDREMMDLLKGNPGVRGLAGATGSAGVQGLQGLQGPVGVQGQQGLQGPPGLPGQPGESGKNGEDGTPGAPGVCSCSQNPGL
jgi:hypothetical protein